MAGRLFGPRPVVAAPVVAALIGSLALAGCSAPAPGTDLPGFPTAAGTPTAGVTGPADVGVIPDDCARVLPPAEVGAVLGMPLDTVTVRTVMGVPAPSVGRTERLDCLYTEKPAARSVLTIRAAAYADIAAARAQWTLNAGVEDGTRRDLPIGDASSVLVQRPGESLLSVVYGSGTVTLTLPARPLPGDRAPGDVLVDLALRTLPAMARTAPAVTASPGPAAPGPTSTSPASPSGAPGPARASGPVT